MSIDPNAAAGGPPPTPPPASSAVQAFDHPEGMSFSDLLDVVNPLHHIPIISTIYEHLTGDHEGAVAEVAGGALWGGPIGAVVALVDLAVKDNSGKSIGDNILSWLGFDDDKADRATAVAQAEEPAAQQSAAAEETVAAIALPQVTAEALPPPKPVRTASRDDDKSAKTNGPTRMGDYLVFGAAGSGQPMALTPVQPAAQAQNGPSRQGNYMVFGAGQPAALTPAPLAKPTFVGADQPASPAPQPQQQAMAQAAPARSFAVPARRAQFAPTALPPPTTGPAAIPGNGPSQAVPAGGDSWFAGAVNAGLDKYLAAQRLTNRDTGSKDKPDQTILH